MKKFKITYWLNTHDDSVRYAKVQARNKQEAKKKFETRMANYKNKYSAYEIEEVKNI